jgi:hypothetical protein
MDKYTKQKLTGFEKKDGSKKGGGRNWGPKKTSFVLIVSFGQ